MIAKRIPSILPLLTLDEAIETTKVHSVSSFLEGKDPFVWQRPFRTPHHTISDAGLLGGTAHPSPGEVSLAQHGALFLDELPEFRRSTLEVMRQLLKVGKVTIAPLFGPHPKQLTETTPSTSPAAIFRVPLTSLRSPALRHPSHPGADPTFQPSPRKNRPSGVS